MVFSNVRFANSLHGACVHLGFDGVEVEVVCTYFAVIEVFHIQFSLDSLCSNLIVKKQCGI